MAKGSVARRIKKPPAVDADKIGKLVRLLASDRDGEGRATPKLMRRLRGIVAKARLVS